MYTQGFFLVFKKNFVNIMEHLRHFNGHSQLFLSDM